MYKAKKILVTGGTGLIGMPLVEILLKEGSRVRIASLDDPSRAHPQAEFMRLDLSHLENCLKACEGMDYVFQLAGIKGSPAMTAKKPASFFVPTIMFNTNMMEAARLSKAKKYLYTSSIGVYSPAEIFHEDDVWSTFPSQNDRFAGWAKRMGELQAEAYKIEYGWNDIAIVRPANVYGPYDNFDPQNAMVIPSLIKRALDGENPLVVWGDGSQIRDFIHARDVARGMFLILEKMPSLPVNLGSGKEVSIKDIVEIIVGNMKVKPKIVWDISKPSGDRKRLMDVSRAESLGFRPSISIEEGIKETMDWYLQHKDITYKRYNVFIDKDRKINSL
ncbi:MAG: NAD-dependent epimerase/dehydratase family protein [Candidatus Omnitrophica bacterium]|nr:NAD-dependent epimerase/dehydratase family protein [Candidatus Omnitrophota bacterium]